MIKVLKKLILALLFSFALVCCKEPDCDVSCKGHECSCKHDAGEDCGLPEDATPTAAPADATQTGDLTSKG